LIIFYYLYNKFNLPLRKFSTDNKNKSNIPNKYEKIYEDPKNQREIFRLYIKGKIGVYACINKINGKISVGSGDPLYLRISDYYQNWYLKTRTNLYIVKAFNKYGMKIFSLIILEYTNSVNLILCEQN